MTGLIFLIISWTVLTVGIATYCRANKYSLLGDYRKSIPLWRLSSRIALVGAFFGALAVIFSLIDLCGSP